MKSVLPDTVSTSEFADLLDVTPRWLQQLAKDGKLPKAIGEDGQAVFGRFPLKSAVQAYIRLQKEAATNTDAEDAQAAEDLRYKKGKADQIELIVKRLKSEVIEAGIVQALMDDMHSVLRTRALAIPRALAQLCAGRDAPAIYALLDEAIRNFLTESSTYKKEDFESRNRDFVRQLSPEVIAAAVEQQAQFDANYADAPEDSK